MLTNEEACVKLLSNIAESLAIIAAFYQRKSGPSTPFPMAYVSTRVKNALRHCDDLNYPPSCEELVFLGREVLREHRGMGAAAIEEVARALSRVGFRF